MGRIKHLDGLRAVSVLLVIVAHLSNQSSIAGNGWFAHLLYPYGTLGVSVFFVISGFVICRSLLAETAADGRASIPAFFIRRLFRILPPLLLYVAGVSALAAAGLVPAEASDAARSLFFVCNLPPPISPYCGGYIGAHLWSLSFEEQFYLVFPFVFVALIAYRRLQSLAIMTLPLLAVLAKMAGLSAIGHYLHFSSFIAYGVFAAYNEERIRALCERLPKGVVWALALSAFLLAGLRGTTAGNGVNALLMPPLLVAVIFSVARIGILRSALEASPVIAIGVASYSIYLWQQLATYAFLGAGLAFYAGSISVCVAGSLLSYRYLETPLIKLGSELSKNMRQRALDVPRPLR